MKRLRIQWLTDIERGTGAGARIRPGSNAAASIRTVFYSGVIQQVLLVKAAAIALPDCR